MIFLYRKLQYKLTPLNASRLNHTDIYDIYTNHDAVKLITIATAVSTKVYT